MNGLERIKRMFSYGNYTGTLKDSFRTNIIRSVPKQSKYIGPQVYGSGNHSVAPSGTGLASSDKELNSYLANVDELEKYEGHDLVETVVGLFSDYVKSHLVDNTKYVEFKDPNYARIGEIVNEVLLDLDIITELKKNMNKIVYYNSHAFGISYNETLKKYEKHALVESFSTISVTKKDEKQFNLIRNEEKKLVVVAPFSLCRITTNDFDLVTPKDHDVFAKQENEDPFKVTSGFKLSVGKPLYYGVLSKLKEFVLTSRLISLLSIKELIQPLIMLIKVEKNTTPDKAAELARNAENLINKYVDSSTILAGQYSIDDIIQIINDNVKVLPDFNSSVENMGSMDLSKLKDKIDSLKGEQDQKREDLLNTAAMPLDLFLGRASKFEAIKSSERMQSKITSLISGIETSIRGFVRELIYMITGEWVPMDQIIINLFSKTSVQYNIAIQNAQTFRELHDVVIGILKDAEQLLTEGKIFSKDTYIKFLRSSLKDISPDLELLLTDETIAAFLEDASKSKEIGGSNYQ